MFTLKPIAAQAVAGALAKAERYRLLNEPELAESICHDALAAEPDNQEALIMLLLSLTDQFRDGQGDLLSHAQALLPLMDHDYERHYYGGIIWERHGLARLSHGGPGSGTAAYPCLRRAMECYEQAEAIRPPGNDDAILRWNTCVRVCRRHRLAPDSEEDVRPALEDF
jgi:hypothetical protein